MEHAHPDEILRSNKLKVTPQRLAVLEAVYALNDHPSTEKIIAYIQLSHPNIAAGTIYKILEIFTQKGIVCRLKTEQDRMRYDAVTQKHHHLYSLENDHIEDYFDNELNTLLEKYFKEKLIPGFDVQDIRVEIRGQFKTDINY